MFLDEKNIYIAIEPKPFTLEHLIAWLKDKPLDLKYDFCSLRNCLLGQYTYAHGGKLSFDGLYNSEYRIGDYATPMNDSPDKTSPIYQVALKEPHTFGAALSRAVAIHNGK